MIPLAVPNLGWRERVYSAEAVHSGWVGPDGPFVQRFEAMVAKAAGRTWAIATITGTAALHACVFTLWGRKDIVVAEARCAFPAMLNVIDQLGGVVYPGADRGGVDHDLQLYANLRREWEPVIADRAPAIGEPQSDADVECYSFAANKIVTCGHGGAIAGDDPDMEKRLREEICQGYGRSGHFNYRMANVNAAIGCGQMERLDELKAAKRRIWQRYADAGLPMVRRGASRWMATINAPGSIVEKLAQKNIEARSEPSGVSIPCSTNIEDWEQDRIIEICRNLLSL